MTIQLVKRSYFSNEDRLPEVTPEHVIDLFVNNPNTSGLIVYRGKKEVGSITISPRDLGDGRIELLMTALGKIDFAGMGEQDIAWRGELELTPEHDVAHLDLKVKFRNPRVNVNLEIDPQTYAIEYLVTQDDEVLIDSDDLKSKAVRRVKMLLGVWGMSPKALKKKEARGDGPAGGNLAIIARHGKIEISGERQSAYILDIALTRGKRFKLYFSEAGELLKVSSVLGYEILSDAFVAPGGAGGKG